MNQEQYRQWTRRALRFDDLPEHLIAVGTLEIEFLVLDRVELGERIGVDVGQTAGLARGLHQNEIGWPG